MYYVASFSGGKDSTAMVLNLIEKKYPLNEVLFCDTGMEYPEIYDTIIKVKEIVVKNNILFTVLKSEKSFEDYLLYENIKNKQQKGYGWPASKIRWCTGFLKTKIVDAYFKTIRETYGKIHQYVGLAFDESERAERKQNKNHIHPLINWKMTEHDCLQYCYNHGFDFGGIYQYQKRASCWCCPLQSIKQMKHLYLTHPELWKKLEEWDEKVMMINPDYKFANRRVKDYSKRFEKEIDSEKYQTKLDIY